MLVVTVNWPRIWIFLLCILGLFLYCEYFVYYVVLIQCSWPQLRASQADLRYKAGQGPPLRVMVLADTHLLGSREGHWFDKLRREWQMERVFQTSMMIHSPDVVFVLGDLFDEGKWCSDAEFHYYVQRFEKMFRHSSHTDLHVVVGNHDIGFHYAIDEHKRRRFASAYNAPSVHMLRIKDSNFVLINSMALEGDRCDMCTEAENKLAEISDNLKCSQGKIKEEYCSKENLFSYSPPIVLQHFPMYRPSDHNCSGADAASPEEIDQPFRQKFDCLSEASTDKLFSQLQPRLVISGHTHNFCFRKHPDGTPEWTVPSFSWRNKKNPSFLLAHISPNNFEVGKCYMPNEKTVIWTYIIGAVISLCYLVFPRSLLHRKFRSRTVVKAH